MPLKPEQEKSINSSLKQSGVEFLSASGVMGKGCTAEEAISEKIGEGTASAAYEYSLFCTDDSKRREAQLIYAGNTLASFTILSSGSVILRPMIKPLVETLSGKPGPDTSARDVMEKRAGSDDLFQHPKDLQEAFLPSTELIAFLRYPKADTIGFAKIFSARPEINGFQAFAYGSPILALGIVLFAKRIHKRISSR
ncbi:hypothetical protein [Paraburkholderia oxyphila]|uniref:hypothetical protein n=1 Tax=Paraburkholderia oxyphila TaxID=614212 RepID=UPI0012ED8330|nr:hypothetical protein [Paraburkholderia oxyphila]